MSKTGKRTDENHKQIVDGLRGVGASVLSLASLGRGAPDIAVGRSGRNYFLEIKNENQPPSKRRLTDMEKEFHESWRGQVATVENLDQALKIVLGS